MLSNDYYSPTQKTSQAGQIKWPLIEGAIIARLCCLSSAVCCSRDWISASWWRNLWTVLTNESRSSVIWLKLLFMFIMMYLLIEACWSLLSAEGVDRWSLFMVTAVQSSIWCHNDENTNEYGTYTLQNSKNILWSVMLILEQCILWKPWKR